MPTDNKRFSITPLSYENADRALPGEIVVDDETGYVYVKNRDTNELVCANSAINDNLAEIVNGAMGKVNYAFNNNRTVYRFYFEKNMVKLDASLNLPEEYVYYQIRDINRATKYYLSELTKVDQMGTSIYPESESVSVVDALRHNGTYFVEFYNINFELMTQLLFTAKRAPKPNEVPGLDKFVDHIVISTNRDILYVNEPLSSLNMRVYAVFGDNSELLATNLSNVRADLQNASKNTVLNQFDVVVEAVDGHIVDVTDNTLTFKDLSKVNVKKPGKYTIVAKFIDKTSGYEEHIATKEITVSETDYSQLTENGLVVVPKLFSQVDNDIRLTAYGYFTDGSMRDITNQVVFSYEGKLEFDTMGKLDKTVLVKFNVGEGGAAERQREVRVTLYSNDALGGNLSDAVVQYENSIDGTGISRKILRIHPDHVFNGNTYAYYRVRDAKVLGNEGYYTPNFGVAGNDTLYNDLELTTIEDNTLVIVEYYDSKEALIGAEALTCKYVLGLAD